MNLRVTVSAGTVEYKTGARQVRLSGMPTGYMARPANQRLSHLQELRIVRAVRLVAAKAVFPDRGVLPEERPSARSMALVAILIHGILYY